MRQLRAEISLGTSGMAKGVSDAKSHLSNLQSMFRMTGKSLASLIGFDSIRAGNAVAKELQSKITSLFEMGPLSKKQSKELARLIGQKTEVLTLTRSQANAESDLTKETKAQAIITKQSADAIRSAKALPWSPGMGNRTLAQALMLRSGSLIPSAQARAGFLRMDSLQGSPPVIPTGLAGLLARLKSGDQGSNHLIGMIGMMLGGGRGAQLGGGIGELLGGTGGALAGLGALAGPVGMAVGMVVSAAIAGFKKIFNFLREGFMDLVNFATSLQNMKSMIGIGYRTGTVLSRASEMSGLAPEAVSIWFSRFQANIGLVEKTSPKVSNALMMLGLSLAQIRQMKPDDLFKVTLERMAAMKNVNDQNAVAMALFNRQGAQMRKELLNWTLAAQQVGTLEDRLDKVEWTDTEGDVVKLADAFSYLGKTVSGLTTKMRDFFGGFFEPFAQQMTTLADLLNRFPTGKIGAFIGGFLKLLEGTVAPILTGLLEMLALFVKVPVAKDAGTAGGLGPLASFFAPFGKGPGDSWSKVGAFAAPGMKGGFATGIQGWHDKVIDKLSEIAKNTAQMRASAREVLGGASGFFKANPNYAPAFASGSNANQVSNVYRAPATIAGNKIEGILNTISNKLPSEININPNIWSPAQSGWTY